MATKRGLSPSADASDRSPKRRAVETAVLQNDDDDLENVLALIKQHEESEALARKLQQEWGDALSDTSGGSDHFDDLANVHPAPNESYSSNSQADDEAFARSLAAQWAEEDANLVADAEDAPRASASRPGDGKARGTTSSPIATRKTAKGDAAGATPSEKLEKYREFFVGSRHCTEPECGHELLSPRGYVTYTSQVPPPSLTTLLHVHCPVCEATFCRGCLRVVPCTAQCRGNNKGKDPECPVLTCCADVRAIALFEALGGFDRHYLGERATSDTRAKEAMSRYRTRNNSTVGPGGTGYSTASTGDYGNPHFASWGRGRGRKRGSGQLVEEGDSIRSRIQDFSTHADDIVVRALSTITSLLPSPYSDNPQDFDIIPHASISWLIQASQIPELLGTLLRNDSVTDWTSRSDVYNAMLALLRRMSDCEPTLEALIGQRYELEKSGGLEEWMWEEAEIVWAKNSGKLVATNPLYAYFQKLTKQCEAFLSGASRMLESDEIPADEVDSIIKSTSICGEIIATRDDLERAMRAVGRIPVAAQNVSDEASEQATAPKSRGKGKSVNTVADLERRYTLECERLAFHHVAFPQDGGRYTTFNYGNCLETTTSSTRNPKDRLHLIRELAVMATSLPPGVWVRVDETRNDALKIMIAGPEGTPYAGGLFEFDCFLPLEYPHKPPLVHLRTTGNGSVRFNPNLYANGKVCLSLLGTWPGRPEEQWSSKSTILQVVVSIQSMILIDLPWFNEPGYGQAKRDHPESIKYNKNIMLQTVRWAMVDWFKDEHRTSIWADVIKTHFVLRAERIRVCIHEWAKQEPQIRAYRSSGSNTHTPYMTHMPHGHPVGIFMPPPPAAAPNGQPSMDLKVEFEQGIIRLQTWEIS